MGDHSGSRIFSFNKSKSLTDVNISSRRVDKEGGDDAGAATGIGIKDAANDDGIVVVAAVDDDDDDDGGGGRIEIPSKDAAGNIATSNNDDVGVPVGSVVKFPPALTERPPKSTRSTVTVTTGASMTVNGSSSVSEVSTVGTTDIGEGGGGSSVAEIIGISSCGLVVRGTLGVATAGCAIATGWM